MTEAGQRVLIVDDEKPIRRYLRAALKFAGFCHLRSRQR